MKRNKTKIEINWEEFKYLHTLLVLHLEKIADLQVKIKILPKGLEKEFVSCGKILKKLEKKFLPKQV